MKQQILKLLRFKARHYDMLVFNQFYCWCIEHSYSHAHLQKLVSSKKLHDWFMREYTKKEQDFLAYVKDYRTINEKELATLYDDLTSTINFYPKPLLNEIRKQLKKSPNPEPYKTIGYHLN